MDPPPPPPPLLMLEGEEGEEEEGDSESVAVGTPASPHQISSDPEPDADDWDEERLASPEQSGEGLALDEVNWDEVND